MRTARETLQTQVTQATQKLEQLRFAPWSFIVAGLFGGVFIGFGGVLMLSAAGPLVVAGDPLATLVSGVVFSAGLIIVVFAGAELVTSTMMTVAQALVMKAMTFRGAVSVITASITANFIGALAFSALVALSGILNTKPAAKTMLAGLLEGRALQSVPELFTRAILCNALVCLGVWMANRVASAGVKIAVIVVAITAFVASGFEHVVANMTFYWLGVFTADPNAGAAMFATNMLWVGLGNLVGGALIVGLGTWVTVRGELGDKRPLSSRLHA